MTDYNAAQFCCAYGCANLSMIRIDVHHVAERTTYALPVCFTHFRESKVQTVLHDTLHEIDLTPRPLRVAEMRLAHEL